MFGVPPLYTSLPPTIDTLETKTTAEQQDTVKKILPYYSGNPYNFKLNSYGIPKLLRNAHSQYLSEGLGEYPEGFVGMDASRPWIPYWSLCGLSLLGEDVSVFQEGAADTYRACQNPTGGFGGGHGQTSHVITSYATVLALVTVGGEEVYELIDRKALWHWLGSMKQKDGGFTVTKGGEEDVRGAYCAMVIISLLDLPVQLPPDSPARVKGDETFMTGLPEWISLCQTFEGGIGGAPDNEAHGAYAFCALACLCIMGAPHEIINKYLDVPSLIHWLSSRQMAPEGGFAGRANKLVDGCYNHWVGGCWALAEAAISTPTAPATPLPTELWSREGMIRYVLCCCQGKRGGLRDKPDKHVDGYHTCYNLCGLSAAQYRYTYAQPAEPKFTPPLNAGFNWTASDLEAHERIFDDDDLVGKINPVYCVPWGAAETARAYFEKKAGF
ncbi:uncharacterized protein K452DRAFT_237052 [Aplosporella prunicola CBS 121167]|uniref:Protein farnesyltransferase subunit beta n=1 Tax=Aplosporella prunicola CBS 121167 TaxID=1176127 RepID=A0A6A6B120_9PEZI|nr:uncharacterized protein K452DRAFT_237052 [Aplosporella prunicola CBS 121167]KAF2136717.1 hypothetical protein K452DRAFT_237052 [Aplosporella prunicola CBS 121167]